MKIRPLFLLLGLLSALSCKGGNEHDTAIIVYVHSDLAVPGDIDRIRIKTTSAGTHADLHEYTFMLGQGDQRVSLPVREGLYPTNDSQASIRVEAQGLLGEILVVSRAAVLSFVPDKKVVLNLSLLASCRTQTCPQGLTCGPGGCQPEAVNGRSLPTYSTGFVPSDSPVADASVEGADALSSDASTDRAKTAVDAGFDSAGPDASIDAEIDAPAVIGTGVGTGTATNSSSEGTQTATEAALTGSGTSVTTGQGTGSTGTGTSVAGTASAVLTGTGSAGTGTGVTTGGGGTGTGTSSAGTGSSTSAGTSTGAGTGTKIGTATTIGTTVLTGNVVGTATMTTTLNVTVPSTSTAVITQTVTVSATATQTASTTYTATRSYTANSTNTATSTAANAQLAYLLLLKPDSLASATDGSTSTQTASKTEQDLSTHAYCGSGSYTYGCSFDMQNVAAGEGNLFCSSSTRFQSVPGGQGLMVDCPWVPTATGRSSISVWVKPLQTTGTKQSILAWNFGDIQLYIDPSGRAACVPAGTTPTYTLPLPLNRWTHLVCTQNGTEWTLYSNGSGTRSVNQGPSTFRNPTPDGTFERLCLGRWYIGGWEMTNTTTPCSASSLTESRLLADLSMLRIYRNYALTADEVDNLHVCNDTTCAGAIRLTGTVTASGTMTVSTTITATGTATTIGTVPTTTGATATGTVSAIVTNSESHTATVTQTGTAVLSNHRLFGW